MGITASIDIELQNHIDESFFTSDLPLSDWGYNDNNNINYIPANDTEYEWLAVHISNKNNVLKEIFNKLRLGENIGIVVIHNKSQIGGQLIYFFESKMVSFNININRKKLPSGKTDFQWYKENFETLFKRFIIKSVKYIEI